MLNFNKKKYVSFDNLKSFNGLLQSSLKEKIDGYKSEIDTKVQKKFNELSGKVQTDSEVIDARKGEASLRAKIDVIDENLKNVNSQLEHIESQNIINAKAYGFVGDGSTLNDDIMKKFIENNSNDVLYFTKGTYLFSKTINFHNNMYIKCDSNVELKLHSVDNHEYFITIRKDSTRNDYSIGSYFKGGIINGNYNCDTVFGMSKTLNFILEGTTIKNPNKYGIKTRANSIADGHSIIKNILLINEEAKNGSYGIYDNGFDNIFESIEIIDFEKAIYTVCGRFSNIKAWIKSQSLLPNSRFAYVDGYDVTFSNIAVDTYRTGFYLQTDVSCVLINNMLWITNEGVYTTQHQASYPRTIFSAEYPDRIYKVNGLKIGKENNLSFSNIDLPYSSFLNVRVPISSNYNPYVSITRYRNDNEKLQNIKRLICNPDTNVYNKSSNFNSIRDIGIYNVNLWEGSGGSNYPNIEDLGILEVMNSNMSNNNLIVQKFYGIHKYAYRIYIANAWQEWNIYNKNTL